MIIFWNQSEKEGLTCGPVQTSFQVDIEIYEDKLDKSGDRILSSRITICFIMSTSGRKETKLSRILLNIYKHNKIFALICAVAEEFSSQHCI